MSVCGKLGNVLHSPATVICYPPFSLDFLEDQIRIISLIRARARMATIRIDYHNHPDKCEFFQLG